jgi:hypothetical protein
MLIMTWHAWRVTVLLSSMLLVSSCFVNFRVLKMTVRECNSYKVTKDPVAVSYNLEVSVRGDCDTCV